MSNPYSIALAAYLVLAACAVFRTVLRALEPKDKTPIHFACAAIVSVLFGGIVLPGFIWDHFNKR